MKAIYNIGYGVYVLTTNGKKLNGCIVNTVAQITSAPVKIMVCVNKENFSCAEIQKTKQFNLSVLDMTTSFDLIERFGFSSGKTTDKFEGFADFKMAENNIPYITKSTNSYLSLKVLEEKDVGSHIIFICEQTADVVLSSTESVTYGYYQNKIKPKKTAEKVVWVCSVCGYVYEGDPIPEDFVCPLCKHGASDFVKQEPTAAKKEEPKPAGGKKHTCLLCGYTVEGDAPPNPCPVCGANMWKSE